MDHLVLQAVRPLAWCVTALEVKVSVKNTRLLHFVNLVMSGAVRTPLSTLNLSVSSTSLCLLVCTLEPLVDSNTQSLLRSGETVCVQADVCSSSSNISL